MDMKALVDKIDQRLEALGLTAAEASKRATGSADTIRNWKRAASQGASGGATLKTLEPIARVLETDVASLVGKSAGFAPIPIPSTPLPYGGKVNAGYFLSIDDANQDIGDHLVPLTVPRHPAYPKLHQSAYLVVGNSMDLAGMPEGMWVVAADYADYVDQVGELSNGNYVIVERSRAGGSEIDRTVKEVQFAQRGMRLVPRSSNPTHKEFFIDLAPEADNDTEQVRLLAVVLWIVRDVDPRSRR